MISPTVPPKIRPDHLDRQALIYVRQSTPCRCANNTASAARQYDLARSRRRVWDGPGNASRSSTRIKGTPGPPPLGRDGFQHLVAQVGLGRAGAVLSLEASRLARSCSDWYRLIEICGLTNTLVIDEDGVYDPTQYNDRLLLGFMGTMSEAELHWLRSPAAGGQAGEGPRASSGSGRPPGWSTIPRARSSSIPTNRSSRRCA